ncbi:MAG: GLPGLI family protein [Saprospiraceae bacterium]|nr:GLPGLI family protein [Saprospiraceae bacterium]
MRNTIFFLLVISLHPFIIQSQENKYPLKDTIPISKVTYAHQVHMSEIPSKNGVAELFFNNSRSLYIHRGNPDETGNSYPGPDGIVVKAVGGDKQGAPIYKMHSERKMLYRDVCIGGAGRCIVSDTFGGINWMLQPEIKRFGLYDCRRATGFFHGREYEAWYALDIPVPSGPFKLGGLPGLILEARTTDGTADFIFISIEFSKEFSDKIKPPYGKESEMNYLQYQTALWDFTLNKISELRATGIDISVHKNPNALELWVPEK